MIASALRERRAPLKQLSMSGNRIRDAEVNSLMAAVGEHAQAAVREAPADAHPREMYQLTLDFDGSSVSTPAGPEPDAAGAADEGLQIVAT